MALREINFDGIVGPSHNYAGLSFGNLASTRNAGQVSQPRAAALQGIDKMRANLALGLAQGIFLPHPPAEPRMAGGARHDASRIASRRSPPRPCRPRRCGRPMRRPSRPPPTPADGRCHLTVANLRTMPHRSHEWPGTLAQLRIAFADRTAFRGPRSRSRRRSATRARPTTCGSTSRHGEPGLELFVYGVTGGAFPARQHLQASKAIARLHGLDPERTLFVEQSEEAIAAGAFHNDVVAVANENVLFAHELAFADRDQVVAFCEQRPARASSWSRSPRRKCRSATRSRSYLFNAQLVTPPDGEMTLVVPTEARETPSVWSWLERHVAGNGPIRRVEVVDVRQSMANGGGPACLRLRVVADPATVDPRFMVDDAQARPAGRGRPPDTGRSRSTMRTCRKPSLIRDVEAARAALLDALELGALA